MQPKDVPAGHAGVCRTCEAVWLDKEAASNLTVKPPPDASQPTLSSGALRCEQCGAPLNNSWQERCEYCGAATHAPTKVVVLPEAPPGGWGDDVLRGEHSVVGEVLGAILRGRI
jgi:hypothetical protein